MALYPCRTAGGGGQAQLITSGAVNLNSAGVAATIDVSSYPNEFFVAVGTTYQSSSYIVDKTAQTSTREINYGISDRLQVNISGNTLTIQSVSYGIGNGAYFIYG